MIQEFEGRTEKEAIDKAIESLGLDREEIDIEIVENKKGILFGKGKVKIKVHMTEQDGIQEEDAESESGEAAPVVLPPDGDVETTIVEFVKGVVQRMGYSCSVNIVSREPDRLVLDVVSDSTGVIIGRKGKNLDALQLLANVYAGRVAGRHTRIVVDAEDYRKRREASLVQLARKTGEQVRRTRGSKLLDAMNPFERRVIHTTLSGQSDIATISEGEGLYKKVRVFYREGSDA